MMRRRDRIPSSAVKILALSLFILPIALTPLQSTSVGLGAQPFNTLVPPHATFSAPFTETPPVATLIPTVAPGQYFDEDDENLLPEVARPDLLDDEELGYSAILGQPGMYLVWSIDDEGNRHYYVLEETSDFFTRIKETVYANLEARRILDESNPLLGAIWAGTKTVVGGVGAIFCGIGTLATLEAPPVAAIFGGCALGAAGLFGLSVDEYIDVINSVRGYENRTEDDRKAIEGIFREIDAAPTI